MRNKSTEQKRVVHFCTVKICPILFPPLDRPKRKIITPRFCPILRRFPGLSKDAAQWIVDSGKVYGVGVDGPSVDPGQSTTYSVHGVLSKANLYNLENVALNGTTLPPRGFKLVIQPVKIDGGTGGPVRILAFTRDAFE